MNYNECKMLLLPLHDNMKSLICEMQRHSEWLDLYDGSVYAQSKNENKKKVCKANSQKIYEYILFCEQVHAQL